MIFRPWFSPGRSLLQIFGTNVQTNPQSFNDPVSLNEVAASPDQALLLIVKHGKFSHSTSLLFLKGEIRMSLFCGPLKAPAFAFVVSTAVFSSMFVASAEALAQATGVPAAGGGPNPIIQMLPIIVMVGIVYFLMIRPQMAKQKKHQDFVSTLKRGDEVLTSSGILGKIEGLTDLYVTLEIAPQVRIRVIRSQIASTVPTATATAEVKA